MRTDLNIQEMYDTLISHVPQCGSRYVLSYSHLDELRHDTDYDFYVSSTDKENIDLLKQLGFEYFPFPQQYNDVASIGLYSKVVNGIRFEVVMKRPEYMKALETLWSHLANNPVVFKNHFWKRNSHRDQIRDRINKFLESLS